MVIFDSTCTFASWESCNTLLINLLFGSEYPENQPFASLKAISTFFFSDILEVKPKNLLTVGSMRQLLLYIQYLLLILQTLYRVVLETIERVRKQYTKATTLNYTEP